MKFSIICPSYGVEKYIGNALQDIIAQSYTDWECIVVEDCSPDRTAEIAEEIAKGEPRIRVVRQEVNKGVSEARNRGLEMAQGEYVLFLDPDDRYESNLLQQVVDALEKQQTDIVIYGHYEDYLSEGGKLNYRNTFGMPSRVYTDAVEIHHLVMELEEKTMYGYPWNKAFRRGYLMERGLRYPVITHVEDILFNVVVFQNVSSVQTIEEPLYHYMNYADATKRLTAKRLENYFELQKTRYKALLDQQDSWGSADAYAEGVVAKAYFRSFFSMLEREVRAGTGKQDVLTKARTELETDLFVRLRDAMPEGGKALKLLYQPLMDGNIKKAYRRAKEVSFVRTHFPMVFAKAKQAR
ncbi:MAG: glycosyltransferase family 2 protein [Lachnospiraceae bacterium]|nr:glycosyltransferase family 2 protein [Lachnospiraceae bacterium]